MKNIIIIGSRGYKSSYGGWETFVTNLIDNYHDKDTRFYVPEITNDKNAKVHTINNTVCEPIYTKECGSMTMMIFVFKAVLYYIKKIKKDKMKNVIMYILGCRVGPLFTLIHKKLNKMGVKIIINPDGLEWKREKWNKLIKMYFKLSERTMIKSSNYVVCDSMAIQKYVDSKYKKNTKFIAYGSYLKEDSKEMNKVNKFMKDNNIIDKNYYLFVGRFVPENNIELIIKEFMKTDLDKDLVIVSNISKNKFYNSLIEKTNFPNDSRIKFVGSVYDSSILEVLRKKAIAYIHGHSAGGTNPSLLEALSLTDVNILYDVPYNREVGSDATLYFNKENNSLKEKLLEVANYSDSKVKEMGIKAKKRIKDNYTWEIIVTKYKNMFDEIIKEDL